MSSVLLVDDDAEWRALWRGPLESAGHQVVECSSGADALRRIRGQAFDLVLLDLTMPDTSGWDVLADVCGDTAGGSPPIVVVTSHAEESSELRARELGAAAYVAKPVNLDDLLALVDRMLG